MLPFVNLVLQQCKDDCGIAAFAMLTGQNYTDVLAAAVTTKHPRPHLGGMMTRQLVALARKSGMVLQLRRSWNEDEDTGLLTVERMQPKADEHIQHLVLLKWGLVFDTDGTVWEPATYYAQHGFKPVSLLMVIEPAGESL